MQSVFDAQQKNRPKVSHLYNSKLEVSILNPNSLLDMTSERGIRVVKYVCDMQIPGHIRGLVSREGYIRLSVYSFELL